MGRGILSGLLWGGVTGTAVVSVLSLYAPLPDEVRASKAETQTSTEVDKTVTAEPEVVPEAEVEPQPEPVVESEPETDEAAVEPKPVAEPEPAVEPDADTETPAEPDAKSEPAEEEAAEIVTPEPAPEAQIEAPQTASNQTSEGNNSEITVQAKDETVTTGQASSLAGDDGETPVAELEVPQTPVRPLVVTETPSAPEASSTPKLANLSDPTAPTTANPSELALPQVDAVPAASGETAPRVAAATPEPQPVPAQTTTVSSETPIKLPVPNIENPVAGVVTNRLPSVTAPNAEPGDEASQEASAEAEGEAAAPLDASEVGALVAYAAAVEGEPTDALFSIILIDDGSSGVARSELIGLDVPFSIAIDPSTADAAGIAADYRAAGVEVLAMLGDLPSSAEPSDVAVAVEGYFGVLNEAIAVMDPLDGRIQSNRSLLQPVLGAIRDSGHGLVTYDRGLNTAQQAARREGIAAATVFRVLDADNEEGPKIKRYLGRAAFNASKDGTVVVVGHSRAETIKAILEWALDARGGELSIVPVSRVMLQDLG